MRNLTAIIVSFLRPEYMEKCVDSLHKTYPGIRIIVGENGHYNHQLHFQLKQINAKYVLLPFDSGVCFARNRLMDEVETDYVLIGDDDFFYDEGAKVDKMLSFLRKHKEFSIIGGRIQENEKLRNYQGYIKFELGSLILTPLDLKQNFQKSVLKYAPCDLTFNYFVARTKDIRNQRWDEKIKVAYEHADWFIGIQKAGVKVAFSPEPIVIHRPKTEKCISPEYAKFRTRRSDKDYFYEKHDLDEIVEFTGQIDYREGDVGRTRKKSVFSVVCTIGDGEGFIKTHKSVLNQRCREATERLAVDTTGYSVPKEWATLHHAGNEMSARNVGVMNSEGEFVVFIKSGDEICPGFLSLLASKMTPKTGIMISDWMGDKFMPMRKFTIGDLPGLKLPPVYLIRAALLQELGGYDVNLPIELADKEIFKKVMQKGYDVGIFNEALVKTRKSW